jgi:hypothetical protein
MLLSRFVSLTVSTRNIFRATGDVRVGLQAVDRLYSSSAANNRTDTERCLVSQVTCHLQQLEVACLFNFR